jgi:hypothetical protein
MFRWALPFKTIRNHITILQRPSLFPSSGPVSLLFIFENLPELSAFYNATVMSKRFIGDWDMVGRRVASTQLPLSLTTGRSWSQKTYYRGREEKKFRLLKGTTISMKPSSPIPYKIRLKNTCFPISVKKTRQPHLIILNNSVCYSLSARRVDSSVLVTSRLLSSVWEVCKSLSLKSFITPTFIYKFYISFRFIDS